MHDSFFRDINLTTSRGDGNVAVINSDNSFNTDINLSTLRGDGNTLSPSFTGISSGRYKPIYLGRGRKHTSICLNLILFTDITLFTSRGDENLKVVVITRV